MNNPFLRLKHFTADENDPQENHATECLAACLVFSTRIRRAFVDFLLGEQVHPQIDASRVEADTQEHIDGGYMDLLLVQPGRFIAVVEVKVKSPEDCAHHREQLEKYRKWLDDQSEPDKYLFTLVRNPNKAFDPGQYGAKRRCWRDLYKHFQPMLRQSDLSDVETSLIRNLCEYLESEGIVSTYEAKDLLSYEGGLRAQRAIAGIFNQLDARLRTEGFECVFEPGKKDNWPHLKIERPDWKNIFGKGQNQKISLWFTVPGIWEADLHDFAFEIELWLEEHGNNWQFVRSRLPKWLGALKSQGFDWTVYETWSRSSTNMPPTEIQSEPKRINVSKHKVERFLNQTQPQNEDDLINMLVAATRQYADIISSLKP
jgi:hypothetical protein